MADDSLQCTSVLPRKIGTMATRRVWLPQVVYECLPYFYILAGFSALFTTLYIRAWYWLVPHGILMIAGLLHVGFLTLYRRYRHRAGEPQGDADNETTPGDA